MAPVSKLESIKNSKHLLESIISSPKDYIGIADCILSDQRSFAEYESDKYGIEKMSLNRWKHYADEQFVGGWRELDALRRQALQGLNRSKQKARAPSRGSKKDLEERLQRANEESQGYVNEIARFAQQYKHLLETCRVHARHDPVLEDLLNQHLQRFIRKDGPLTLVGEK